jgi:hypothetical protein
LFQHHAINSTSLADDIAFMVRRNSPECSYVFTVDNDVPATGCYEAIAREMRAMGDVWVEEAAEFCRDRGDPVCSVLDRAAAEERIRSRENTG